MFGPKVAEGWRKGQEKGWGDIATFAQLSHPMATTLRKWMETILKGILCLSRALRQWEGPTRDIFATENTKEYKSRKVEKRNNSRWERQSTGRKEGQQGKKCYFSREKHKPQKRIKSTTKGEVETKQFTFVPFSNTGPKDTSLNTISTDKNFHHILFFPK